MAGQIERVIGDDYRLNFLGLLFIGLGALFAETSYSQQAPIDYVAVGLSSVIVGAAIMLVPRHLVSKTSVIPMINDSFACCEAILNRFELSGDCTYMPPNREGSYVLIPVKPDSATGVYEKITRQRDSGKDVVVAMPLSTDTLSKISDRANTLKALNTVLRGHFQIVKSIRVREADGRFTVNLNGYREKNDYPLTKLAIGSQPTIMAGCVLSYLLKEPIKMVKEEYRRDGVSAIFELVARPE